MAGNPANAALWTDADVYVGPTNATNPADVNTAFSAAWDLVGLLDGDAGFTQSRSWNKADIYAWGNVLVRTSRRNFKLTMKFTALEGAAQAVRDLVWPGSSATDLVVPRPAFVKVAFERREGTTISRLISTYRAEVEIDGDIVDKESDLTKYPLLATIYPEADGSLFVEQSTVTITS